MQSGRIHRIVASLYLIWFGLSYTLAAGGMVICRDGHGESRIEWRCERAPDGECLTSCGDDSDHEDSGTPHPCEDSQISEDQQVGRRPARFTSEVELSLPVFETPVASRADDVEPASRVWTSCEPQRPPDSLVHIRTIVLVV